MSVRLIGEDSGRGGDWGVRSNCNLGRLDVGIRGTASGRLTRRGNEAFEGAWGDTSVASDEGSVKMVLTDELRPLLCFVSLVTLGALGSNSTRISGSFLPEVSPTLNVSGRPDAFRPISSLRHPLRPTIFSLSIVLNPSESFPSGITNRLPTLLSPR